LSGTGYSDAVGEYIWIDCAKWFSRFQINVGDRIQIKNLTSLTNTPATTDFINYLQNDDGLLVAGIAFARTITAAELLSDGLTANQVTNGLPNTVATSVLVDGSNNVGYARYIIVRGRFSDPTTGSMSISPYGGAADNSLVGTSIVSGPTRLTSGKLINLSRQTQLIFRVITREYDSTSLIRPDNL
jgi:hypothetical protein